MKYITSEMVTAYSLKSLERALTKRSLCFIKSFCVVLFSGHITWRTKNSLKLFKAVRFYWGLVVLMLQ